MRPTRHSGDSRKFFDWLEIAAGDLLAARLLLEQGQCVEVAAFHCQQGMEKALKAYLIDRTGVLVDGHNLTWLCRRAASIDAHFQQWMDESAALNRYYIETRYPTDIPTQISDEELSRILAMTEELFFYLSDALDVTGILDYLEAY